MTTRADASKCGHAACDCTVESSLAYCCEYCARADQEETATAQQRRCDCGHPECLRGPDAESHGDPIT